MKRSSFRTQRNTTKRERGEAAICLPESSRVCDGAVMKRSVLLVLCLMVRWTVAAPVGSINAADGSISTAGSTTTVTMNQSSQINWSSLSLAAGESLKVMSSGGPHASLNIVTGSASTILGGITADGPFYLVNPAGIFVGASGSITAPQVLLSTLSPADGSAALKGLPTTWSTSDFGTVQVEGSIAAATSVVILSETISIGATGSVKTSDTALDSIEMIAASSGVSGNASAWTVTAPARGQTGTLSNTGRIEGHTVQLISHGSLANGGLITTGGAKSPTGDSVLLRAVDIVNETQGTINSRNVKFEGDTTPTLLGKVINPDDGSNPGATTGTTQVPRLSGGAPQAVTQINPGQLSFTTLKSVQLDSPKPTATTSTPTLAVRRGADELKPKPKKVAKLKRTSFFGVVK